MRISAWSSDVCSSDLADILPPMESSSFLTSAYLDDGVGRECIFRHFEIGGRRAFADARGGIVMGAVAGAEIAAIFAAILTLGGAQRDRKSTRLNSSH